MIDRIAKLKYTLKHKKAFLQVRGFRIGIVDSLNALIGQSLLVEQATKMVQEGGTLADIVQVREKSYNMWLWILWIIYIKG